jgi:protein-tyrosine-phosphatase/phosphohistidine swiveling domain-containing protein
MARRPLWNALPVLVAAWLSCPAGAMDAAAPTDLGPAPVSGAGAGASVNGAAGGVSAVPALSAGIAVPLSAPLVAAPLAAPVAAPGALAASPLAAAAPAHAAPAAAAKTAPSAAATIPISPGAEHSWGVPKAAPGEITQKIPVIGHEAGHDAGREHAWDAAVQNSAFAGKMSGAELKALFDGEAPHAAAPDDALPAFFPKPKVPALKPFEKGAASLGPEASGLPPVEAPQPPKADPVETLAAKMGVKLSGLWQKVKQGLAAKPPPEDAAPVVTAPTGLGPAGPLFKNRGGLLVHAPRALRFDALGYRVHFAPPEGAPSKSVRDEAVRVRVERGESAAGTEELRARFAVFNALIEDNFAALGLIAQSSSKMTVKTARLVSAKVDAMLAGYAKMVGPREAADLTTNLAVIGIAFDRETQGLADGDPLPEKAVELVMRLDKPSFHQMINNIHQAALREVGRTEVESPANLVVKLGFGAEERAVSLVDLSEHPLVRGGRLVSPAFKALIEAMTRSKDQPKGSLLLQDHQFWGHFKLGAHSAEVYANFLPPDEGGMIRVRYQEWGTGYDNQTRLYYVARLLQKAGFHVEQDNGFLTAVVDKDHASQTVDEMTDTFALVIQALHATVGVDFALPLLVEGAKTSEEVGARIDQWVDLVLGEGTLPFYIHDDHAAMVRGWHEYEALGAKRDQLRAALNRTLAGLGLPAIPAAEVLGQRTIDRFVNGPIAAAVARGALRMTKTGSVERAPAHDELATLAVALTEPRGAVEAARMAEAVSSLDPGLLPFETVGSLGALNVERAERRLEPGDWLTVYALRDPKTGQIGMAEALISDLKPGKAPGRLDPAELFKRLAEQGYPVASFKPAENPAGLEHFARLLKTEPSAEMSLGRRAQGLAASPGHGRPVLARATYDKEKAARGGYVFIAPYTTPDDLDAIRASKAVITTSGGLLSHAAITTREMGIPAAILSRAEWRGPTAVFESPEFNESYRTGGLTARRRREGAAGAALAEGALVSLDPATGAVEIYPDGITAPLLDAERALERYDAGRDGAQLTAWLSARMKSEALYDLQKAALIHAALNGLGARALSRPEAAGDLAGFYAALPKGDDKLAPWTELSASAFFGETRRAALELLREKRVAARNAMSVEAVERALRAGEARAARLAAIAAALGRPEAAQGQVDAELAELRAAAKTRGAALLAADVTELQEHARLFPNATVEVLPRLKAAIAKAKRRGVPAETVAAWERKVAALERTREESMRAQAPAVLALRQVLDMDVPRVGGKAAKLGEISEVVARAGGEVPPGLALTVDAYRRFLRESGIDAKLERVADDPDLSPDERAARARKLILDAPLSAESGVGQEIVAAMHAEGLAGTMLAVRSSAVDEDGADAAFAGAGDTHLYVKPEELLPHVKEIWASLWNPRALLYRQTKGLSTTNLAQAVVVQAMADSEVSGVAFTQDPVSGDSSRLIVNAAFGLGEGVVSGRVAPDSYVVGKSIGREILPATVADKKLAIVRGKNGAGTEEHKMPAEWRRRRSMTPAKLEKLNTVALALESHFGYALDIEFGFVGDKLYVLQARPVTNGSVEEPAVPAPVSSKAVKPAAKPLELVAEPEAKRLMFVCTGNTCRSPMAERLAKQKLRDEGRSDFEVLSRGLYVSEEGAPMADRARAAMRNYGANADGHAALAFSDSDAVWADVILTMTSAQARDLLQSFPSAKGKVFTLGEYSGIGGDISDPYAGDDARYREAAAQISAGVEAALDRAEHPAVAPSAAR